MPVFEVTYADAPLITWDLSDGLDGDPQAVQAVRDRVAQGGTVATGVPTERIAVGLTAPWQAYHTVCDALNAGPWGGHYTVTGDIGAPEPVAESADIY